MLIAGLIVPPIAIIVAVMAVIPIAMTTLLTVIPARACIFFRSNFGVIALVVSVGMHAAIRSIFDPDPKVGEFGLAVDWLDDFMGFVVATLHGQYVF